MPVSDMHIVQLSHFILHACFSSTSHPLRSLFNPQARLTHGGRRLGSECQHRVCTLQQHMVCHNLISERGCTERQRLACTIVCYYTSLCVPFLQTHHTLSWPTCSIYTRLSSDTWRECCQHWGVRARYRDRQSLTCILYSYHTSFCMPVSGMHIVQLSHFILHACFLQPLRALFSSQARLTEWAERLGSASIVCARLVQHA